MKRVHLHNILLLTKLGCVFCETLVQRGVREWITTAWFPLTPAHPLYYVTTLVILHQALRRTHTGQLWDRMVCWNWKIISYILVYGKARGDWGEKYKAREGEKPRSGATAFSPFPPCETDSHLFPRATRESRWVTAPARALSPLVCCLCRGERL